MNPIIPMFLRSTSVIMFLLGFSAISTAEPSWRLVTVDPRGLAAFTGIAFVDEKIGWIWSDRDTIWKSNDGGAHWSVLKTNIASINANIARLWFSDEVHGWAAASIDHEPAILQTRDGGLTWSVQKRWQRAFEGSLGTVSDVQFVDATHGWAVGFNGFDATIFATTDGGRDWKLQYSGSEIDGQFKRVLFTDRMRGWALSPMGIMQTDDAGESWHLRYLDGGLLSDIAATRAERAWAAGARGSLLHTQSGVTWSQVPLTDVIGDSFVGWVKFANSDLGWASGANGEVLKTIDGGKTWTRDPIPEHLLISGMSTGDMAITKINLFLIANPGFLLVRVL